MTRSRRRPPPISDFIPELGGDPRFKVAVSRAEPAWAAGYLSTVDVYDLGDLSLAALRDEFGGGTLRLKVKDAHGLYLAHRTVKISAPIFMVGHRARARSNPSPVVSSPPPVKGDGEISSLRKEVAALTARVEELEDQVDGWERRQRQAEALVKQALEMAQSDAAESKALVAIEKARERREAKDSERLFNLALLVAMILIWKST